MLLLIPLSNLPIVTTAASFVKSKFLLTIVCILFIICAPATIGSAPAQGFEP